MKVRFFSNYDQSADLLERFIANYNVYDKMLTFTNANDYDYALVFNRTDDRLKPEAKIITIIQEPSWSPVHSNNPFLTNSDYLIVHDPQLFEDTYQIELGKKVFEAPAYMFYHDHIDKSFFIDAKAIQKSRKLSMIVSSINWNVGNYGKRLQLVRKILNSDLDIDLYGRGLDLSDERYKGALKYKYAGLLPYEYSIAIENSNEKNYITEKFVDCALCDTIPLYCGAPNISQVYNEKYFRTIDLDSPTIIDDIKAIIAKPATKPELDTNKNRYFQHHNLYKLIKDIIKQEH